MKYEIIPAGQLTPELAACWRTIQAADPELHSPFLTPEWTRLVASVRADVEVAVLEEAGAVAGFFPFQRSRWNCGKPVGSRMCDVQSVIATPEAHWNAVDLVTACRLKAWEFHQLPTSRAQFSPHVAERFETVHVDLAAGFEAYAEQKRRGGSHHLKTTGRFERKAAREVGPVRFSLDNDDTDAFENLLAWKSAQYRSCNGTDILSFPWVNALVRQSVVHPTPEFGGLVFTLHFGETLAAVEMGLRCREVFHSWITAYNRDLKQYSPGSIVAVEIAKTLPSLGITRMELGKNNLRYKAAFGNAFRPMTAGCVAVAPCARLWCLGRRGLVQLNRSPWLAAPARVAKRVINPVRGWLAFR